LLTEVAKCSALKYNIICTFICCIPTPIGVGMQQMKVQKLIEVITAYLASFWQCTPPPSCRGSNYPLSVARCISTAVSIASSGEQLLARFIH
jgi:hypothetical protein